MVMDCDHSFDIDGIDYPLDDYPDCPYCEIERLENENTRLLIGQRAAELRLKAYEMFYGIMSDISEMRILSGKGDPMLTEREWEKATEHRR